MSSVFVLWSGGLDSTYLIVRLLESGHQVHTGYVEIQNNAKKTKAEVKALKKLVPKLHRLFPHSFNYYGKIYAAHNHIHEPGLKFRQVPYFIHALLATPRTDYRALGYVAGDSAIKLLEDIRAAYNAYAPLYNGSFPKLCFPIKNISKQQIIEHMSNKYASFLKDCWWCENPPENLTRRQNCRMCKPCRRMLEISF